ncbi:hypothetical protein [Protaetiibacter larvae]|uniref:Uncharacterized protein n=1 Tax=Protaetiibacter larvae TaxID=2592654 RepID=A0A5C1Y9L2_9MICO|nr:hypothetical protein [Protaetiibacter larvae]QEO09592.1 hypothetical protein FLP23_05985 [Protaetiibacter larvae]
MNSTLTREERHTHSPTMHTVEQTAATVARTERRVGLIDRAALRLGMALIRWGRRPGRELARYERRANRLELALLHREHTLAVQAQQWRRDREVGCGALIRIR